MSTAQIHTHTYTRAHSHAYTHTDNGSAIVNGCISIAFAKCNFVIIPWQSQFVLSPAARWKSRDSRIWAACDSLAYDAAID